MDIEKLEKLNELKEKGILTEEEFNIQKKELLGVNEKRIEQIKNKKGVCWKNFALSFLIAFLWLIVFIGARILFKINNNLEIVYLILTAICMAVIAYKLKTEKYKNCAPVWGVVIGILFFRVLAIWIILYQFLQIKDGNAILKDTK